MTSPGPSMPARDSADRPGSELIPSVLAGLVAGLLGVVFMFSYAAVILGGDMTTYVPRLAGHFLFGAVVVGLVIAVRSRFRGVVALPQDNPTAVMAAVVVSVAAGGAADLTPEELFTTVVVAIALSTAVGAAILWLVGRFHLAQLVHYVPYPVVAGFLAATGWLLFKGSFVVMAGQALDLSVLGSLTSVAYLWVPGLVFGATLLWLTMRSSSPFVAPVVILVAIGAFYVALLASGMSIDEATENGWLLAATGGGLLLEPIDLSLVSWQVITDIIPGLTTVLIIVVLSVLLNLSALSSALTVDPEPDHELRSLGGANALAALGGSLVGYHYVSLSTLGHRMRGDSRLVGIIVAVIALIALTVGSNLLSYIPRFVLGGMVVFAALGLLDDWLVRSFRNRSRVDLAVILAILVVVELVGFLEGILVGLLAAIVIFIVSYGRTNVVRHELNGQQARSTVERPASHARLLAEEADALLFLKLHGFVFFATTVRLIEHLQERIATADGRIHRVILDFEHVTGVDTSALHDMVKLKRLAGEEGLTLVASSLDRDLEARFATEHFDDGDPWIEPTFPTADEAIEWCEDELLREHGLEPKIDERPLAELIAEIAGDLPAQPLVDRFEAVELASGAELIHAGAHERALIFVERGALSVYGEQGDVHVRLRRAGAGAVLGVAGFFRHGQDEALSTIRADEPSRVQRLSLSDYEDLERSDPVLAAALQRYLVGVLSDRFTATLSTFERTLRQEA